MFINYEFIAYEDSSEELWISFGSINSFLIILNFVCLSLSTETNRFKVHLEKTNERFQRLKQSVPLLNVLCGFLRRSECLHLETESEERETGKLIERNVILRWPLLPAEGENDWQEVFSSSVFRCHSNFSSRLRIVRPFPTHRLADFKYRTHFRALFLVL